MIIYQENPDCLEQWLAVQEGSKATSRQNKAQEKLRVIPPHLIMDAAGNYIPGCQLQTIVIRRHEALAVQIVQKASFAPHCL